MSKRQRAPEHLADDERAMWQAIVDEFDVGDAPGLAVLRQALEAHQLARECWSTICKDGLMQGDRPHPLLLVLRDSRKAFSAMMKQLDFAVNDEPKKQVGRPPHPVGAPLHVLQGKRR